MVAFIETYIFVTFANGQTRSKMIDHWTPNIEKLRGLLENKNIVPLNCYDNSKASDYYVRVTFIQDDGFEWTTNVPYEYRRSNLKLESEEAIAEYLVSVKQYFTKDWIEGWRSKELEACESEIRSKLAKGIKPSRFVSLYFLKALLTLKDVEREDLPENPNKQRRLQYLKDLGYTIAIVQFGEERTTSTLLPFPKHKSMGYETDYARHKARIIRILGGVNAFEAKKVNPKSLIPDHKFSEVRWDADTKGENPADMTEQELKEKFQLLDNQRNEQKREVCRKCFQEGKRGTIYGITFFYEGTEDWDDDIPRKGREAERGCIGCPWYDIERWRTELMKALREVADERLDEEY